MAASSLAHFFISPPPRKTLNPKKALTISSASLLPSPKPRIRRRNHLRPKLPLPRKPHPGPKEEEAVAVVAVEVEEEKVEESVQELTFEPSQSPAPLPNPNPSSKSAVLDLSLRFAALLAVQTAAAIWLFSRGSGGLKPEEESTKLYDRVVEKDVGKIGEQKIGSDFDRVVSEIREMAREARETEAKEREENELKKERFLKGVVGGSRVLEKDLGGGKSWSRKRLGFVRTNVARRKNVGKGFNGSKKVKEEEEENAGENGGIRQIGHQNPPRESLSVHESRQLSVLSEMTENTAAAGVFDTLLRTIERSEMDHATSLVNGKFTEREIQVKQSVGEGEIPSSRKCRNINGRSESPVQKKAVGKRVVNKNKGGMLDHGKKLWWLKLPYVLAILLSRGSDRSYPKGLYSLKMDSPSGKEGSESCTILFRDQGDATNFCYLLESFFEEWDDFSADVVPLAIHELEEGVRSSELKVIVVKKGQLQLYAGQPLSDVESALRSLLLTREK